MKTFLRLAKKSAKENYKELKKKSPMYCSTLEKNVKITKIFFNHIVYNNSKNREEREIKENNLFLVSCFREYDLIRKKDPS